MSLTDADKAALARIAEERKQRELRAAQVANKPPDGSKPQNPVEADAEIKQLAKLSVIEYEREREIAAERIGARVTAIDSIVKAQRDKESGEQLKFLPHWAVTPWPEPVDGDALLKALQAHLKRYIVLPKHADAALALWILHTWIFECFDVTPYLCISSPTRRCGKTALMTMLLWLCCRGKKNDSMSKASIYRSVERDKPTLCLDEVSWVVDLNDERQNILCGGFERNGCAEVCEGEGTSITTKMYSTFCPKAFGLIGKLTATLMDRAIEIPMQRKMKEPVERLRRKDNEEHATLRRRCLRWAQDHAEALAKATPELPAALNDRAADYWEPLLSIAAHVGGDWLKLATDAALALSGGVNASEERAVELLSDIKAIFDSGSGEISTKALIATLCADEERPWAVYGKAGKPINAKQIAALLRSFPGPIISETVHAPDEKDAKGYKRSRFEEAFARYLTPAKDAQKAATLGFGDSLPSSRPNADETGTSSEFRKRPESNQDGSEKAMLSYSHAGLDGRTGAKAQNGGEGHSDQWKVTTRCLQCGGPIGPGGRGVTIRSTGTGQLASIHADCLDGWQRRGPSQ